MNINALHDVVITLDNGIGIELFIKNSYHHFNDEHEQLVNEMKKLLTIVLMFLGGLSMVGCNQQSQQIQSNQLLAKGNVINIDISSLPEGYNYSFGGEDVKSIIDYLSDLNLDSKFEENPDQ